MFKAVETIPIILYADANNNDQRLLEQASDDINFPVHWIFPSTWSDFIKYTEDVNEYTVLPDLILVDYAVFGNSFIEIIEEIKSNKYLLHIPVIVYTSFSFSGAFDSCYEAGANAYIIKPGDYEGIKELFTQLVNFWFKACTLASRVR